MKTVLRSAPFLALALCAPSAHAGILPAAPVSGTAGAGVATASALTITPNDYPSSTSFNDLTSETSNTAASSLDLVFSGTNSGGTTQYGAPLIAINATGSTLLGYEFQLGTGTGAGFVPFGSSSTGPFFLTTPSPTSTAFTSATATDETLTFTGGSLANGSLTTFNFDLAVPDLAAGSVGTSFTFTLRETPLLNPTPEPSALAALGLGAMAVMRRRKRA